MKAETSARVWSICFAFLNAWMLGAALKRGNGIIALLAFGFLLVFARIATRKY